MTISTPGMRARCAWEVTAGIIPGTAMREHTKRWVVSSETFYAESEMDDAAFKRARPDGRSTFIEYRDAAFEYAKSLADPRSLNCVRIDWIWF